MHTANADVLLPQRSPSMTPWMLFVVAVVSGLGAVFVQKQKLDVIEMRSAVAADEQKTMRAQLAEAASQHHALQVKVQDLESENTRLKAKVAPVASAHIAAPADPEKATKKKKAARKHHKRR
jgi:cell division protein FtsB